QRFALAQEIVAREAVLDAYDIAHLAELGHTLKQDHFHDCISSVELRSRPQSRRPALTCNTIANVEGGFGKAQKRQRQERPAEHDGGGIDGRQHDGATARSRSEEHTSELQSLRHLVCRLLLE